jgi:hypothetical protein
MDIQNEPNNQRRNFLGAAVTVAAGLGLTLLPNNVNSQSHIKRNKNAGNAPSDDLAGIYNVVKFGARGDSSFMNTTAIQTVIDKCSSNGGGTVFFPPGDFLTGTLQIKTNVNLHLSAGTTIWGSKVKKDYHEEHPALISAVDANNISITGQGTINANGESFWKKENGRWVTGEWRPSMVLSLTRCENVLLESFTIRNSPAWTIHPIDCTRMNITGISIINGVFEEDGPNTDGIDPDGCSAVTISNCYLKCGDDAIVLKITDRPGGNKISRDITVTNCIIQTTETALKIGSESYGEFRNITFSNCTIRDSGCAFGLWMRDGGLIDGMIVSNITMDTDKIKNGGQPIYIWSHKRTEQTPWGTIRNVMVSNMTVTGQGGMFISGAKEKHIEGLTFENIRIVVQEGRDTTMHENPPDPFTPWGHHRAPFDIFCRYVDNLKLRDIELSWSKPEKTEWGGAIRCWHVNDLEISSFIGRQSLNAKTPVCWLKDVRNAFIYNCRAVEGANTFLKIEDGTQRVSLMNNELSNAKRSYELGAGISAKEIFEAGNRLPV